MSVLTDDVRSAIMKNVTRRMTPQPLKIRADIDMTCFAYDGVLHIQVTYTYMHLAAHMTLWSQMLLKCSMLACSVTAK